jgi:hypothetical protein
MARFRKRPIVIEAFQWQGEPIDGFERISRGKDDLTADRFFLVIPTLEGTMYAVEGDWIITGVKGEYYPCKDEIFRMSYEPVSEDDQQDNEEIP